MFLFKNKFVYVIASILMLLSFLPVYCFAKDNTSFVWSDISTPVIETASAIMQNERKFLRPYLWWRCFN